MNSALPVLIVFARPQELSHSVKIEPLRSPECIPGSSFHSSLSSRKDRPIPLKLEIVGQAFC